MYLPDISTLVLSFFRAFQVVTSWFMLSVVVNVLMLVIGGQAKYVLLQLLFSVWCLFVHYILYCSYNYAPGLTDWMSIIIGL